MRATTTLTHHGLTRPFFREVDCLQFLGGVSIAILYASCVVHVRHLLAILLYATFVHHFRGEETDPIFQNILEGPFFRRNHLCISALLFFLSFLFLDSLCIKFLKSCSLFPGACTCGGKPRHRIWTALGICPRPEEFSFYSSENSKLDGVVKNKPDPEGFLFAFFMQWRSLKLRFRDYSTASHRNVPGDSSLRYI